jgi:ribonuclease BN (tRNA processing enzyme)
MHAHKFSHVTALLLVHFSPRYTRQQIITALDTNLPPSLREKCHPLLNGFN